MELSEFTPLGLLDLSDQIPLAETIYNALKSGNNARGAVNFDGPFHEARLRGWAIQIATTFRGATRVEDQIDPEKAYETLANQETEFGIVVPVTATLASRRGVLSATMRIALGGTYSNVYQALHDLLGSDFVGLKETAKTELIAIPTDPATGPANFAAPTVARKTHRLVEGVPSIGGGAATQHYLTLDGEIPDATNRFTAGEWVVIEPEIPGQAERSKILLETTVGGNPRINLQVSKSHEPGCIVTTMPWPYWLSTKRTSIVRVSLAAATNPETRRKINELMARMSRTVSTWAIASPALNFVLDSPTNGIIGASPFRIDHP